MEVEDSFIYSFALSRDCHVALKASSQIHNKSFDTKKPRQLPGPFVLYVVTNRLALGIATVVAEETTALVGDGRTALRAGTHGLGYAV